ncbi:MAG TPA: HAMP domain-containing sensor histidine kinase [Bacillota bacterium]|nr:HAMP domain-containing sensor histidine kinase [Bacillota bacterium]
MDIKSKSFNGRKALDRMAFFLCVVLFLTALTGAAVSVQSAQKFEGNVEDLLFGDSYRNSVSFQREFSEKLDRIQHLLNQYGSEEAILSGKSISEDRVEDAVRTLFYSGSYQSNYSSAPSQTVSIDRSAYSYGGDYDWGSVREQFRADHQTEIARIKEIMIQDDLKDFRSYKRELDQTEGFSYYASDGVNAATNVAVGSGAAITKAQFSEAPAYLIYEQNQLTKIPASEALGRQAAGYDDQYLARSLNSDGNENLKVYLSFDGNYLADREQSYADARAGVLRWLPLTAASALASLICLIYLIAVTGRKDEEGTRTIHKIDRVFTEFQLLIIAGLFLGGGAAFWSLILDSIHYGVYYNGALYSRSGLGTLLSGSLGGLVGFVAGSIGLAFILSVVRNIKAGRFWSNSLIVMAIAAVWRGICDFYHGGSVMKKVVLIALAVCLASMTVMLGPVVFVLIVVLAPRFVKKYEAIRRGVDEVKNGNLTYKIEAAGSGELDELARGINEISEASNLAVQNELKNQRLKTDLISNVSHDLKTPLTSIITYIDLLKQEGLDSPDAPKYLEILDQKSIRLKKLTEDLFDAAKASSGAIPVKLERVDMLSLINQGLGEMGDRIEASNLEFKINAEKEKYYVRADGQLLWRVVENLLNNVLKYAQEGSRVYIDLREQNGKMGTAPNVIMEIKNISRTELNIDADELMERFKRGDESRATEGSGLGLAIAKDLVRLQNGWFEIKIDGDLFKAIVMLEAYSAGGEDA